RIDGMLAMANSFASRELEDLERISRYEQRLENSMYRALKQLEKMRCEKRKRTQNGEPDHLPRCPFVPPEVYEELKREREQEREEQRAQNERSEATHKEPKSGTRNTKSETNPHDEITNSANAESKIARDPELSVQPSRHEMTRTHSPPHDSV